MAITAGHLNTLTKERLVASRPIFTLIPTSSEVTAKRKPLLASVINSAPKIPAVINLPVAISMAPLDTGRIHLPDVQIHLGWNVGAQLQWVIEEDHILLTQCATGQGVIDPQGRYLLPVAARRRLGITSSEQMLLMTSALPLPCVRIYPCTSIASALLERNEK
ncbi:MAG: hypothetical protein WCO95_01440 [Actinomycetes bacterium]